jgi:hypothetical protein
MLSAHSNHPFCSDCLKLIQSETKFVYEKGILMPSEHMYETYETRSQIQKTITHAPIEGYDFLIPRMKAFSKPKIRLCGIDSKDVCYKIFCDEAFEELIGILKTPGSDWHEY